MLRLALLIWIGLIGYKIYEVCHYPSAGRDASVQEASQETSFQKPAFNRDWKGNTLQKIKAPRNTKAQMTSASQNDSSGS